MRTKKFQIVKYLIPTAKVTTELLLFLIIMLQGFPGTAQNDKRSQRLFEEAAGALAQKDFETAIKLGEQVISRDSTFAGAHLLLADLYHETGNASAELHHLRKASIHSEMPLIQLRLGDILFVTGEYSRALKSYTNYIHSGQINNSRREAVERKMESCRFALEAMQNPVDFKPERLPETVNSRFDDYWPVLSIDQKQLVITRLIKTPGQLPQEDFYYSEYDDENGWSTASPVEEINTPENEGAQALSADGSLLFFTACNRRSGFGSCDIYYSIRIGSRWSFPVNAGSIVNSAHWDAQPSFSSDGRYLYFASNRPGGKGLRDLWRAECLGVGKDGKLIWEKPINLGDSINTPGNETSPFIHAGNKNFYFASDYHTGMGGYDIFVSELKGDSLFRAPVNLGYPVNTNNDEQGLHIGADGLTAYFSTARDSIYGLDIYSFKVDESIRPHPATYVKAMVRDKETREPLQAEIELLNLSRQDDVAENKVTDRKGEVLMCIPVGDNYSFSVSKEGYLFYSNTFDLREIRQIYDPVILDIDLEPVKKGAEMHLYNIYFETDSFRILPESVPELFKLVEFLNKNSELKIEIQGHTDNTGNPSNNMDLSEKRARSVVNFLIENNINKTRLSWKGYGEEQPVAGNETEEGRRRNRRTTIRILDD